jgi:hypothetical protein
MTHRPSPEGRARSSVSVRARAGLFTGVMLSSGQYAAFDGARRQPRVTQHGAEQYRQPASCRAGTPHWRLSLRRQPDGHRSEEDSAVRGVLGVGPVVVRGRQADEALLGQAVFIPDVADHAAAREGREPVPRLRRRSSRAASCSGALRSLPRLKSAPGGRWRAGLSPRILIRLPTCRRRVDHSGLTALVGRWACRSSLSTLSAAPTRVACRGVGDGQVSDRPASTASAFIAAMVAAAGRPAGN